MIVRISPRISVVAVGVVIAVCASGCGGSGQSSAQRRVHHVGVAQTKQPGTSSSTKPDNKHISTTTSTSPSVASPPVTAPPMTSPPMTSPPTTTPAPTGHGAPVDDGFTFCTTATSATFGFWVTYTDGTTLSGNETVTQGTVLMDATDPFTGQRLPKILEVGLQPPQCYAATSLS